MGLGYGRTANNQRWNSRQMPWVTGAVVRGAEINGYNFSGPIRLGTCIMLSRSWYLSS